MLFKNSIGFSVAFLNIRSLSKHIPDIAEDPFIRNFNIILLTETQVLYNQEPNMQNQSENHQLLMHNVPIDRFKNLEVFLNCFKKIIFLISYGNITANYLQNFLYNLFKDLESIYFTFL